jgi:hypothetical protein
MPGCKSINLEPIRLPNGRGSDVGLDAAYLPSGDTPGLQSGKFGRGPQILPALRTDPATKPAYKTEIIPFFSK